MRRPFVLVSHAPRLPTGTSRIATDLATRLWTEREALGIDLLHVGSIPGVTLPATGLPLAWGVDWPVWGYPQDAVDGSKRAIETAIRHRWGLGVEGVLFVVENPERLYNTTLADLPGWRRWAYLPIDAHNRQGSIGGPAGAAIRACHRVLACAPFGKKVLATLREDTVEVIPHGYDPDIFRPTMTPDEATRAQHLLDPTGANQMVLGCVAANQPRKDWGLFMGTLAELRARGMNIRGWAHIDREIGEAWSLPELASTFGLDWRALTVTTSLTDRELATCYARCVATLAIGRGEGFGYPILESMACGTPAVHVDAGGGRDLTAWRVSTGLFHLVGPYALERPIVWARETADRVQSLIDAMTGGVAYRVTSETDALVYRWDLVWPQFRAWFQAGLEHPHGEQ